MPRKLLRIFVKIFIYFHVFLLVALVFTHCTFTHYAKKSYAAAKKEKPYDVVIVPGVPYEGDNTTGVMKMRLFWSKHLYDSGYTKNIIFSGSSVYSPYVEGVVMKIMADSLGIPPEHTFSETKAEHSTENVYYSWRMARGMGFKKIALATDHFQAGLLRSFMKRWCPGMKAIPIVFDADVDFDDKALPKISPLSAYVDNFVALPARENWWQRFQGTLGTKVKKEALADRKKEKAEQEGENVGN
jgi:hypothetical protein